MSPKDSQPGAKAGCPRGPLRAAAGRDSPPVAALRGGYGHGGQGALHPAPRGRTCLFPKHTVLKGRPEACRTHPYALCSAALSTPLFQKIPPPFPASRPAGQTGHFKAIRRLPLSQCIKPHGKRGRRSFGSREALHFEKSQVQAFLACFFTSLLFLLKKAFTISTMGMMASASSTATAYSSRLTVSNWKARASGGI